MGMLKLVFWVVLSVLIALLDIPFDMSIIIGIPALTIAVAIVLIIRGIGMEPGEWSWVLETIIVMFVSLFFFGFLFNPFS